MFSARSLGFKRWAGAAFAATILLIVLIAAASKLWQFGVASPFTDPLDLRAFYCAGAAIAHGANPYRLEPVRTCQRKVLAAAGLRLNENFVLPAPLPPYALVVFSKLALLPYRFATELWMAANIAAIILAIYLTSRLSGARPGLVALSLFPSAGIVCLSLGQVVPIVIAAVLLSAFCARRGNGSCAAAGAAVAAIEPHLALPVWLALGFFVPVARKPLGFAALALGGLTLLPGVALNLEYVRSVLPQHARAELLNFEGQYGLSSLLAAAHVPSDAALHAGTACYAIMLVLGLVLGVALQRRFAEPAFLILVPAAAVVLGGPFLHIQQTAVAIPLGFMLVARLPRRSAARTAAAVAIVLLAIPWPLIDIAQSSTGKPSARPVTATKPAAHRIAASNESIEIPYAAFLVRFERRPNMHSTPELIARKLPTWFALMILIAIAASLAYDPERLRHVDEELAARAA